MSLAIERLKSSIDTISKNQDAQSAQQLDWQKAGTIATILAAFGALITVILSIANVKYARDAVHEAHRQADSALRAYILIKLDENLSTFNWTYKSGQLDYRIKLVNYGQAPAVMNAYRCRVILNKEDTVSEERFSKAFTTAAKDVLFHRGMVIGPLTNSSTGFSCENNAIEEVELPNLSVGGEQARKFLSRDQLTVVGFIDYEDVDGTPHETTFCLKYRPDVFSLIDGPRCNKRT